MRAQRSGAHRIVLVLFIGSAVLQTLAARAESGCLTENAACYRGCPPTTPTGPAYPRCWQDCDRQTSLCIAEHERQSKADSTARQCLSLAADKQTYGSQVDAAIKRKRQSLVDMRDALSNIRHDLESDYAWQIGDPGSARERVTMLALTTKTTTDLIEDLGALSTERAVGLAKDIYEKIESGKSTYQIVTEDANNAAVEVILDAGAQLNPVVKAAKALRDFAENVGSMSELQGNLDEVRGEYRRQLADLDSKIGIVEGQLMQIGPSNEEPEIDKLFATYQSVRQMCTSHSR